MTTADDTSAPTRYLIEHLRTVREDDRGPLGLITAWVLVGTIEIEGEFPTYRTALAAWAGEQTEEPPLGAYRVVKHESFGSSFVEFELVETREREIRQIERVAPVAESAVQ